MAGAGNGLSLIERVDPNPDAHRRSATSENRTSVHPLGATPSSSPNYAVLFIQLPGCELTVIDHEDTLRGLVDIWQDNRDFIGRFADSPVE